MERELRFSKPGVLSPNARPAPLTGFVQALPFIALATRVLGNEATAAEWMCTPALALGLKRPVDVLLTNPQLVEDLLLRLEAKTFI